MKGLLTEEKAAEAFELTPRCLQNWRTKGGGPPYIRIGHRTVRYDPEDLERWLEERKYENTAQEARYSGGSELV